MTNPSMPARIEQLKAVASYIDQGSGNGTFVFYEGTKPADTTVAADNTKKLVTLTLPKPSLKDVNSSNITLQPTDAATVIKTGTASWVRLYNGNGAVVADFSVGTDITLTSAEVVLGGSLNMSSMTLSPPT